MKDKINEILLNNIHPGNGMFDQSNSAEELTQLMCYREARAIIEWIGICYLMEYEESVVEQLGKTYDSDMVWDVIEQVKIDKNEK